MQLSIPVYLEDWPRQPGSPAGCRLQPLFGADAGSLVLRAHLLSRGLEQLRTAIGGYLKELAEEPDQRRLTAWLSQPELFHSQATAVRLEGRQRPLFLVSYRALDRTLAFVPRWPRRHFEVPEGERLEAAAERVLGSWIKRAESVRSVRVGEDWPEAGQLVLPDGVRARLTAVELEFKPPAGIPRRGGRPFAGLGGNPDGQPDGGQELRAVGRRLNDRYPHELDRAQGREELVAALDALLAPPNRQPGRDGDGDKPVPVLLLGPRKVGKSCLLEEWLWQHLDGAPGVGRRPLEAWQLAPARLISGMSYLGEWEERVLAILDHAARHRVLLVFDDLPGLFLAGISSGSDLSVGDLLLPWLEQRRVRVVASATPEAWARLRERRRRFTDQFQVLPLKPPPPARTWQILAHLARQLERQYPVRFTLDAVPTAHGLCARFERELAFPGNVATLLKRLAAHAARHAGAEPKVIDRAAVLADYARASGIAPAFLDGGKPLTTAQLEDALGQLLQGQPAAVSALAGCLARFKAGLNNPKRPLGVFLLVGPTGVGKTQCAKALAQVLNGAAAHLLRFDLNEFGRPGDAARLTGTLARPDGLLTAAVRRQPCAVLLFDEIEKAAPEVNDLLLGLLDEGRLSDALGRVADFTRTVILLTSNLGAREAGATIGFGAAQRDLSPVWREAVRRHFRPEFFNRLDEVIVFAPFAPEALANIADGLVQAALERPGLKERCCVLEVSAAARAALVRAGQDPALGARALKRTVESALVQPLARHLAARPGREPTLLSCDVAADGSLALAVLPLRPPPSRPGPASAARDPLALQQRLDVLDARIAERAPAQAAFGLAGVDAATRQYFALRELRMELARRLERWLPLPGQRPRPAPKPQSTGLRRRDVDLETAALEPLRWAQAPVADAPASPLVALDRAVGWLEALVGDRAAAAAAPVTLRARVGGGSPALAAQLLRRWLDTIEMLDRLLPDLAVQQLPDAPAGQARLRLTGQAATRVAALETGAWLLVLPDGLVVLRVECEDPAVERSGLHLLRLVDGRGVTDLRSGLELPAGQVSPAVVLDWWLSARDGAAA